MKKYQIDFSYDNNSGHSYSYFECSGDPYEKAADFATEVIEKRLGNREPERNVTVREYDPLTREPKKNGLKFKLRRSYTEVKYSSGRKERSYYYSPILPK